MLPVIHGSGTKAQLKVKVKGRIKRNDRIIQIIYQKEELASLSIFHIWRAAPVQLGISIFDFVVVFPLFNDFTSSVNSFFIPYRNIKEQCHDPEGFSVLHII